VLVFTRKLDEAIIIGDGVEVRILRVGRHGVKLGITAPSHIAIHRREIYDQIREENRQAATMPMSAEGIVQQLRQILEARQSSAPRSTPEANR